ncbi:penicillin-binding protein [Peribacillus muralis]|uniref:Penicillin-binding protein n=1 Tax=Peribacillus muralis TaxID=264697 RepID=A0A1B3XUM5_9BACI|nr:transglycosylase domain-containing protein [Peribacillus muralis]AOH56919.1 penicillin-binding protein [Peribacillus muralis]
MRTYLGYITIFLLVPVLTLFIFLSYQEWSSAESPYRVLDERIPIDSIELAQTSYMTAANGKVISELSDGGKRTYLKLEDIPLFLENLFIVSEDQKFYEHGGVDLSGISRALLINSQHDAIEQGGSTITQQLARNVYLNHDRTYNRKLSELLYAYQLERKKSKPEIMELYLNAIYFSNGAYGIEAASQLYFSKPTQALSKAELAFLAAIPNNPVHYNPLEHFDATKNRQERLLKQMVAEGELERDEYDRLIKSTIRLNLSTTVELYPDYVTYVHQELKNLVASSEGLSKPLQSSDEAVRQQAEAELGKKVEKLLHSGVTIHTALDTKLQTQSKTALQANIGGNDIEGAIVVIQHHTHELVSLIGGKDYKKNSFNRAYQSYRQPGSAIKPLLDYAPYIEETGADINQLVSGASYCSNSYCPRNYSGDSYGMVTLRTAFAQSYNTPAIRLFEKTGIKKSFSYLDAFDFKRITMKDHHISSAIGGFEYGMSPLELTNAYTSFEDGHYQPARAIMKVTDQDGKILYSWKDKPREVWSENTVSKMRKLLHEVTVTGTGRKAYFPTAYIGGKTGTTNDVKDMWFVGQTANYTTGVWIGKDRPANLQAMYARSPHMLIWKDISQTAEQ